MPTANLTATTLAQCWTTLVNPSTMRPILTTLLLLAATYAVAQEPPALDELEVLLPATERAEPQLVLYPNPTTSTLRVIWGSRSLVRMPLEVRSLDGRLLLLDSLSPEHELDVSTLDEGFYRLFLMDLGGVRAQAVFKVVR